MAFPRKKQQNEKESSTSTKGESAMESSTSTEPKTSKCVFKPTVFLKDWWLKRTEADSQGRTLAVAGNDQAMQVFSSAPILKAFDVFTLETIDGICVVLKGFINKTRSEENGFPSEVFQQFLIGFPPQWEVFNKKKYLGRESAANHDLGFEKSEKVKDLKKHSGRKGYELQVNLKRDDKNDGKIAKKAESSSAKLNCTSTAKEQTSRFKSPSASATTSTNRILTYEPPQKEKDAVPVISSFKRSRSGRLLLPPMEFWRNQMPIYNADRQVTSIKQGNIGLDNPRSESSRKRRLLR